MTGNCVSVRCVLCYEEGERALQKSEDVLQAWRALVMSGSTPVSKIDGEWHVGCYQGVMEEEYTRNEGVVTVANTTRHDNQGSAQEAIAAAMAELERHQQEVVAKRLKSESAPEEAMVPDNYARNVVESASTSVPVLSGVEDLMQGFAKAQTLAAELQKLYESAEAEAQDCELPEKHQSAQPVVVQKLCDDREYMKVLSKLRAASDEVLPELESLIGHIEKKELTSEPEFDAEWTVPLQEAKKALEDLGEGRTEVEVALKELATTCSVSLQPSVPADLDQFKEQ